MREYHQKYKCFCIDRNSKSGWFFRNWNSVEAFPIIKPVVAILRISRTQTFHSRLRFRHKVWVRDTQTHPQSSKRQRSLFVRGWKWWGEGVEVVGGGGGEWGGWKGNAHQTSRCCLHSAGLAKWTRDEIERSGTVNQILSCSCSTS